MLWGHTHDGDNKHDAWVKGQPPTGDPPPPDSPVGLWVGLGRELPRVGFLRGSGGGISSLWARRGGGREATRMLS